MMKGEIISSFVPLLKAKNNRIPWRILPAWLLGNRLRILMYHSIAEDTLDIHAVSSMEFRRHMQALQSKQVVSLRVAMEYLQNGRPLNSVVVITFDDALLDFYTHAIPILREFGYPVSMFVPTGLVGGKAAWDGFDQTKPLMTWKQLEECQKWNISFGSHTASHAVLTACDNRSLRDELSNSLETLGDRLENVLPVLAYPGGFQDGRVRMAARQAGYRGGLGVSSRWGNGRESDLMQLRRERFH